MGVAARKGIAFAAYGTEGLRIFDLALPNQALEVASFDSYPGNSGGRHGACCVQRDPIGGRIYLGDMDAGLFILASATDRQIYGEGTPGFEDLIPALDFEGSSAMGRGLSLALVDVAPQAPLLLLLGGSRASLKLRDLTLLVDPTTALLLPAGIADRKGSFRQRLSLPASPGLRGGPLYLQYLALDKVGSLGFAASRGLAFKVFRP